MFERPVTREPARRDARDPLADEVVVDFPSTAGLAERMRASFFGTDDAETEVARGRATHTAEVQLTARQADEGTEVPVDLPLPLTCPMCGGRGEVWNEVCGVCTGTGGGFLLHQVDVRVPPGVHHGTRLRVSPRSAPDTHVEVRIAIP